MNAFSVILTLAILCLLILGVLKKYNAVLLLSFLGVIAAILYSLAAGVSMMGETSSGSILLDVFELYQSQWSKVLSSTALILLAVMGYVGYMNYLKASDMFAILVAKPFINFKNAKWAVVGIMFFLVWVITCIIPSGVGTIALLFGTFYPVMRYLGVSKMSAGTAICAGTCAYISPSNMMSITQAEYFGIESADYVQFWAGKCVPMVLIAEVAAIAVFIFWNSRLDKKEAADAEDEDLRIRDISELGIPRYFAVLPLLPLVFIIGFSNLVQSYVTMSIVGATFLSFTVAFLVRMISCIGKKKFSEVFNEGFEYFKSVGGAVGYIGMLVVSGSFFSTVLNAIGGFDIMTNWLINQVNLPIFWFIVIMTLICAGLYGISGSFVLSTYAVTPVVAGAVMSNHPELAMFAFCCLAIAAPMFGSCITPISNGILFSSGFLKVPVTKIIRRGAVAGAAGMLMVIVASFIIYA